MNNTQINTNNLSNLKKLSYTSLCMYFLKLEWYFCILAIFIIKKFYCMYERSSLKKRVNRFG